MRWLVGCLQVWRGEGGLETQLRALRVFGGEKGMDIVFLGLHEVDFRKVKYYIQAAKLKI